MSAEKPPELDHTQLGWNVAKRLQEIPKPERFAVEEIIGRFLPELAVDIARFHARQGGLFERLDAAPWICEALLHDPSSESALALWEELTSDPRIAVLAGDRAECILGYLPVKL